MVMELAMAVVLQTAPLVRNPRYAVFECPDHALDTNHDIQILKPDGSVLTTLTDVGDPDAVGGTVTVQFSVQPIAFGQYRARVRAKAGALVGDWSEPSDVWERAPEQTGKPGVGR